MSPCDPHSAYLLFFYGLGLQSKAEGEDVVETMSTVPSTSEQGKGVVLVQKEVVSQMDSEKESQSAAKEVGRVSHDSDA